MASTEQTSPQPYPPYDPSTNPDVQEFLEWVDNNSCTGVIFEPDDHGQTKQAKFLPDRALQEFFDCKSTHNFAKVQRLVAAASKGSSVRVDARSVAHRCPKVFAILVMIGKAKYLNTFVTKDDLRDRRLPFRPEAHTLFPRLPNGKSFFDEFCQKQWQFCAEPLSYGLESLAFDKDRILPIIEMTKLDKHQGASAVVHKVRVHPDFDELAEHMPFGPVPQTDSHEYVIKSYHNAEAEKYFYAEVDAFQKLNGYGEPVPNLIGFYGAFKQNGSFHVILEYANAGTLEDYFETVPPPREGSDIMKLWTNLFQVNHALVRIHAPGDNHEPSSSQRPKIFQGWHQDIKPTNILVSGDVGNNPYEVRFMLADLGLSHFTAVVEDRAGVTGEDTHGARAYRAPECNLAQSAVSHFAARVKQSIDTWSLACVYSEVNVWIVDGFHHGLSRYRNERQLEAATPTNSTGACFHDNKGHVLDKVQRWHTEMMPRRRAAEDPVTKVMWDELLKYMFVSSKSRIDAQQVVEYSENVLTSAQRILNQAPIWMQWAATTTGDASPPRTPRNIPDEFRHSHPRGGSHQANQITPPYDHGVRQSPSELDALPPLSYSPDSMSTDNETPGANGNRDSLATVLSYSHDHGEGSSNAHTTSMASGVNSSGFPSNMFPEPGQMSRARINTSVKDARQDQPFDKTGSLLRSSTVPSPAGQHSVLMRTDINSGLAEDLAAATSDEDVNGKGKSIQRAPSIKKKPQGSSKIMTVDELKRWAEMTRTSQRTKNPFSSAHEQTLPFETELIGELRQRDHIFIIDDSESMRQHWTSLISLYRDLIYMVKKKHLDPNGSELQFIRSEKRKEKRTTSELVKMVSEMRHSLKGEANFAHRLNKILEAYKAKSQKKSNTRPISLYVLTDGRWQGGNAQLNDVARAVKRIVEFLDSSQAPDKKVGIQFIRFGNDEVGKQRLKYLDAEMPKVLNLTQDICDTTSAEGNVWKMMLGSINSTWDGDDDD